MISNATYALVRREVKNPFIKITLSRGGPDGIIEITDNGGGIDADIIEKIFQPYFTTKTMDGGTGMGLYIAKMIIEKNMQGTIAVESQNGGTTVRITLKEEK